MQPYGMDLRGRVLDAYRRGEGSIRELAEQFELAPNTVQRWLTRFNTAGTVAPLPHGGGANARLTPHDLSVLWRLVTEDSDATLATLASRLAHATRCHVHRSTISRALARLDVTQKKKRSTRPSGIARMSGASAVTSARGSLGSHATG
jgi:transposase